MKRGRESEKQNDDEVIIVKKTKNEQENASKLHANKLIHNLFFRPVSETVPKRAPVAIPNNQLKPPLNSIKKEEEKEIYVVTILEEEDVDKRRHGPDLDLLGVFGTIEKAKECQQKDVISKINSHLIDSKCTIEYLEKLKIEQHYFEYIEQGNIQNRTKLETFPSQSWTSNNGGSNGDGEVLQLKNRYHSDDSMSLLLNKIVNSKHVPQKYVYCIHKRKINL